MAGLFFSQRGSDPVIHVDGSMHSGSGTLLRYAVTMATLTGEPLHMIRVRQKRDKPGLRPQHLQGLRASASFCKGRVEGDEVGSQEIVYYPGPSFQTGSFEWDIGTAGSTTMVAYTLAPLALFARAPCRFTITGGLFQDFAPSAFHMQKVLFPLVEKMGARIRLTILRPGYVPEGQGRLELQVEPLNGPLEPLRLTQAGVVSTIQGLALASHLRDERVSERMALEAQKRLLRHGYTSEIEVLHDTEAVQKGAALLLWAESGAGCILGSDRAGRRGRSSESIAAFVVEALLDDLRTGATTDRHLADQLILYAALAQGKTEYLVPGPTDHITSNLWLVEKILGARAELQGQKLVVHGIGFYKPSV